MKVINRYCGCAWHITGFQVKWCEEHQKIQDILEIGRAKHKITVFTIPRLKVEEK